MVDYLIYNATNLSPLSTYWFRVRAKNIFGTSDWTAVTSASTDDVYETSAISRPLTLHYSAAQHRVDFEVCTVTMQEFS